MYANLMSWAQQAQFHEAGMASWLVKCKNILTPEISDKKREYVEVNTNLRRQTLPEQLLSFCKIWH